MKSNVEIVPPLDRSVKPELRVVVLFMVSDPDPTCKVAPLPAPTPTLRRPIEIFPEAPALRIVFGVIIALEFVKVIFPLFVVTLSFNVVMIAAAVAA